jgi:hypothetical protein
MHREGAHGEAASLTSGADDALSCLRGLCDTDRYAANVVSSYLFFPGHTELKLDAALSALTSRQEHLDLNCRLNQPLPADTLDNHVPLRRSDGSRDTEGAVPYGDAISFLSPVHLPRPPNVDIQCQEAREPKVLSESRTVNVSSGGSGPSA